jgi:hypothetical protein
MTALYPHSAEEHASGLGSIAVPSRTGVGPNTRLTGDQCQGKAPVRLTPPRGGVQTRPVRRQLRVPSRRRACPKGTAMVVGKSTSLAGAVANHCCGRDELQLPSGQRPSPDFARGVRTAGVGRIPVLRRYVHQWLGSAVSCHSAVL